MPLKYDATVKDLVRSYPQDWLAALGVPGSARVLSADLSAVSAFADLVLHLGDALLHLDFQTGPDPRLPRRALRYNVLLFDEYNLPVETVIVLLRRQADRRDLTGVVEYAVPGGRGSLTFRFQVVRLWERPAADLLAGGLGLVPLAVLGALPDDVPEEAALRDVVERLAQRLTTEAPPTEARKLMTASFILTGLRIPQNEASRLFAGVSAMRESSTYQAILAEGAEDEARRLILRLARRRLGDPDATAEAVLRAITDLDRLERIHDAAVTAANWPELLATS
jgi:predicted transposase YdaD